MLSTGIPQLDLILGGGLPTKKISEFYGANSTGKTSIAIKIAANIQKKGTVAYFDLEDSFSVDYAENNDIDLDNLYLVKKIEKQYLFDVLDTFLGENWCDLIIIDSLATVNPKSIDYGLEKIGYSMIESNTSLLVLNQVRANIDKYGEHSYGSQNFKSRAALRVKLEKNRSIRENGVTIGNWINFEVIKNRFAPPLKDTNLRLDFDRGFCCPDLQTIRR